VPPLKFEFGTSAERVEALPDSPAEVALIGRSNVGKSSLLNALAHRTNLANVSKTPGRTRLLNQFALPDGTTLVDCPGYGYASASRTTRAALARMTERYLLEREPLEMVLVCVDGAIGPTKLDVEILDWARESALPHTIVATKHDKVKASQRERRKRDLAAACNLLPADVVWVSAAKGTGIDRLRDLVRMWLTPRK
jgi:GTP-binding protein